MQFSAIMLSLVNCSQVQNNKSQCIAVYTGNLAYFPLKAVLSPEGSLADALHFMSFWLANNKYILVYCTTVKR